MHPQTLSYAITGMHCAACSSRIEKVTGSLDAVEAATVSLATNTARITYRQPPTEADIAETRESIARLGFSAELMSDDPGEKGLHATTARWEQQTRSMYEELALRKRDLIPAFAFALPLFLLSMGEMLGIPLPHTLTPAYSFSLFALIQLALCLPVMWSGRRFFLQGLPALWRKSPNMDSLVALGTGSAFLFSLYVSLEFLFRHGFSNPPALAHAAMSAGPWSLDGVFAMLFAPAQAGAMPHLYYESAAVVIALVSLGKYLETRSRMRTTEAIKSLLDLAPETAVRLIAPAGTVPGAPGDGASGDGAAPAYGLWQREEVPLDAVVRGDILAIRPGGRIPVDGVVAAGRSFLDESMLTGESMPVEKQPGDPLTGGTMNQQGALFMRAERVGADTVLARIVQLVQDAQGSKAAIASLADTVSLYFVPVVMAVALATGIGWYAYSGDFGFSLQFMVSVLVIACPCAMGLATPMSIMVASGRGAQLGVLFKNGQALENTSRITTMVFDKTGTLTLGAPALVDILPLAVTAGAKMEADSALQLAASLEASSEHPLARAICAAAREKGLPPLAVQDFNAVTGKGIHASIATPKGSAHAAIGNLPFAMEVMKKAAEETAQTPPPPAARAEKAHGRAVSFALLQEKAAAFAQKGATPVVLLVDGHPAAMFAIADPVAPEAAPTIAALHKLGIDTVMLTGDNRITAEAVARRIGISRVVAEVLPQGKDDLIRELQAKGRIVGMVGDGVNDAPALARADVGFAMNSGIDVAVETGDVVLMRHGIMAVHTALGLGKATLRNIRENLFWAFAYNVVGIPFAAGVFYAFGGPSLSPMLAGAAMALSSVSVVTNALRLRFFRVKGA